MQLFIKQKSVLKLKAIQRNDYSLPSSLRDTNRKVNSTKSHEPKYYRKFSTTNLIPCLNSHFHFSYMLIPNTLKETFLLSYSIYLRILRIQNTLYFKLQSVSRNKNTLIIKCILKATGRKGP